MFFLKIKNKNSILLIIESNIIFQNEFLCFSNTNKILNRYILLKSYLLNQKSYIKK